MLQRGFWLYVWRIRTPKGDMLYVGRTGSHSGASAASPLIRLGKHLDFVEPTKGVLLQLQGQGVSLEACDETELVSYGPLFPEVTARGAASREDQIRRHQISRDVLAGLEKQLRDALDQCGYQVLNTVSSRKPVDAALWADVKAAFAKHFPKLKECEEETE
tara:strand:+ start:213 stop:695 length:483 start_codon:yes stop_codon:yes gene_type:complete